MALLSQMIRTAAITGSADTVNAWFAGRQGKRWAEQTIRAALPTAGRPARGAPPAGDSARSAAETLRELIELHERGALTDTEFEQLRTDLRV